MWDGLPAQGLLWELSAVYRGFESCLPSVTFWGRLCIKQKSQCWEKRSRVGDISELCGQGHETHLQGICLNIHSIGIGFQVVVASIFSKKDVLFIILPHLLWEVFTSNNHIKCLQCHSTAEEKGLKWATLEARASAGLAVMVYVKIFTRTWAGSCKLINSQVLFSQHQFLSYQHGHFFPQSEGHFWRSLE